MSWHWLQYFHCYHFIRECEVFNLHFFGLILQPKLVALSNAISFANPDAPLYPRLAQGKQWNEVSSLQLFSISLIKSRKMRKRFPLSANISSQKSWCYNLTERTPSVIQMRTMQELLLVYSILRWPWPGLVVMVWTMQILSLNGAKKEESRDVL